MDLQLALPEIYPRSHWSWPHLLGRRVVRALMGSLLAQACRLASSRRLSWPFPSASSIAQPRHGTGFAINASEQSGGLKYAEFCKAGLPASKDRNVTGPLTRFFAAASFSAFSLSAASAILGSQMLQCE